MLVRGHGYPLFDHLTRPDFVMARYYDLDLRIVVDRHRGARARDDAPDARSSSWPEQPDRSSISAGELDRLAAICAPRGVAIIADEVLPTTS